MIYATTKAIFLMPCFLAVAAHTNMNWLSSFVLHKISIPVICWVHCKCEGSELSGVGSDMLASKATSTSEISVLYA
jgi:hypothetical protein